MQFYHEDFNQAAARFIAEGGRGYITPDFKRLLTIIQRSVIEVNISLYLLKKRKHLESKTYRRLNEQCELIRNVIVHLKNITD